MKLEVEVSEVRCHPDGQYVVTVRVKSGDDSANFQIVLLKRRQRNSYDNDRKYSHRRKPFEAIEAEARKKVGVICQQITSTLQTQTAV